MQKEGDAEVKVEASQGSKHNAVITLIQQQQNVLIMLYYIQALHGYLCTLVQEEEDENNTGEESASKLQDTDHSEVSLVTRVFYDDRFFFALHIFHNLYLYFSHNDFVIYITCRRKEMLKERWKLPKEVNTMR